MVNDTTQKIGIIKNVYYFISCGKFSCAQHIFSFISHSSSQRNVCFDFVVFDLFSDYFIRSELFIECVQLNKQCLRLEYIFFEYKISERSISSVRNMLTERNKQTIKCSIMYFLYQNWSSCVNNLSFYNKNKIISQVKLHSPKQKQ